MKKVEWGFLYNKYHKNNTLASSILEEEVKYLRADIGTDGSSHLTNANGIYEYVLAKANGEDKPNLLSRRAFSDKDKKAQYERQRHVCPHCKKRFEYVAMCGDHIVPYNPIPTSGQLKGTTTPDNLQMLCHSCNLNKTNNPFDKEAEEKRLQEIYSMSDKEVNALELGAK